jgi:hypothetical protein
MDGSQLVRVKIARLPPAACGLLGRAKVPGTGWLYRRTLERFIQRCADGLAAQAASLAAGVK